MKTTRYAIKKTHTCFLSEFSDGVLPCTEKKPLKEFGLKMDPIAPHATAITLDQVLVRCFILLSFRQERLEVA